MRWGRAILGVIIVVIGVVWFLQGVRVLPGSFMTGSAFWTIVGAVVAIAGVAILLGLARRQTG